MPGNIKSEAPISPKLHENENYFKDYVGMGTSFDIGVRKFTIMGKGVNLYYVTGLCDSQYLMLLLTALADVNDTGQNPDKFKEVVENRLVHQQVTKVETIQKAVTEVLSGLVAIMLEGADYALVVDVRSYPGRNPEEPDTEKVVRGARDGFVENIIVNTALIRRRVRDERLRYELTKVGERSKTDVCVAYIEDIASKDLVDLIKKELKEIRVDGITMGDKTVEEFLVKQGFNPFPMVRYTERADVAANHLVEGHVLIIVDTSPSVIITPTTLFHHVQHAEEYRQAPAIGTFLRWVRFLGILSSTFLLPFWFLFILEPSLLPKSLSFVGPNEQTNIPAVAQIFLADFGIEFLRMAAIHTPTALSTAMGLIAAVLIGQIAIDVGLFVPEVILYVSIAAIGSFTTPSYELSVANKIIRLLLLAVTAVFHVKGFIIGVTAFILYLASTRTLNTPYLWPFLPFNAAAFKQIVIRTSVPGARLRPSIVHPQDIMRQRK
ncbi:spore germination protein [Bacillus sp. FJAT-42376]|uniref:spore germination protein n=1 Tax=Bacillus sp. FJAT-42376 TaxID=2014076 RepID=UPI000F50EA0D|nr:spore germination protein [Bacillus sp. FJAT-42376]AZB43403.1 spore germination protein [Bacillus sp. FJAT-42376]